MNFKYETLNRIFANENFIRAVSTVIATKREVKKVLHKQIASLIKTMEVVTHSDLSKLMQQLKSLEAGIEDLFIQKKTKKTKEISKKRTEKSRKKKTAAKKK